MTNHLTENARLSTPPDDAEVRVLESWLRNPWSTAADNVERGPIPDWLYALMQQAADALTSLSHAHAAERKLADDLADGLVEARDQVWRDTAWHLKQNETLAAHAARRKE
jgi:hypothetical protein